jgi:hypothetical protein
MFVVLHIFSFLLLFAISSLICRPIRSTQTGYSTTAASLWRSAALPGASSSWNTLCKACVHCLAVGWFLVLFSVEFGNWWDSVFFFSSFFYRLFPNSFNILESDNDRSLSAQLSILRRDYFHVQ